MPPPPCSTGIESPEDIKKLLIIVSLALVCLATTNGGPGG